jgi:hypothetical protein
MRDGEHSTLWRISEFERLSAGGQAGEPMGAAPSTMLPSTLQAELYRLYSHADTNDVLEVMAACLRHRESALLHLALPPYVWSATLFPIQGLYHAAREVGDPVVLAGLGQSKLLSTERAGLRPPGHYMTERVASPEKYRPLSSLLWTMALHGPRSALLTEISGRSAYRLAPGRSEHRPVPGGALAPAVERLRRQAASLRDLSRWPGMSVERACRLLNALYLTDSLMTMRSHPQARREPMDWRRLLGRRR